MSEPLSKAILTYHESSKHRLNAYAPSPGELDWVNQPNPLRRYVGAQVCELPLRTSALRVPFADVRCGQWQVPVATDLAGLATLLELSFGLSAWKEYGTSRWALRCNPSSGNLHPTECYVLTAACTGLASGVHHYVSHDHGLERRAEANPDWGSELAGGFVLILTSIHWREAWKYGLRAFRYCQHDCGHALAAVSYAAATLGWRVQLLENWSDALLASLSGVSRVSDYDENETEATEIALWVGRDKMPEPLWQAETAATLADGLRFVGHANHLSAKHVDWAGIDIVQGAAERPVLTSPLFIEPTQWPSIAPIDCMQEAADLIRQRRSAVDFDGYTTMSAIRWFAMLDSLLPRPELPPWGAWPHRPRVHLILFVHRVKSVIPGIYILVREKSMVPLLRKALRQDAEWATVSGAPQHLCLFRLFSTDAREVSRLISCHQNIAADGCFSLGMLAEFETSLRDGAWRYRELFHEAGLIGQVLYLEAEAAGLRGTGIGCYFDDVLHELLGLSGHAWQCLYHFTVGGPLEDQRLRTRPPYMHLVDRQAC